MFLSAPLWKILTSLSLRYSSRASERLIEEDVEAVKDLFLSKCNAGMSSLDSWRQPVILKSLINRMRGFYCTISSICLKSDDHPRRRVMFLNILRHSSDEVVSPTLLPEIMLYSLSCHSKIIRTVTDRRERDNDVLTYDM